MARRRFQLDETDQALLDCRRENANEPVSELAAKLHLDESSVRRRERRLIDAGVLSYAAIIDYDKVSTYAIEAYVELAFAGNEDVHELLRKVVQDLARPEIREAFTLIGDVDAVMRIRARNVAHLRELVMSIRTAGPVLGTKTRIIAGRRYHGMDTTRSKK